MKLRRAEKKDESANILPDSPLKVSALSGETIVDLNPEMVAIYRRWYTFISREEPLPKRGGLVSAIRGEGVTTISLGLAAVLAADLEIRIALVECNWWWPGLRNMAHLDPGPGLAELVLGHASQTEAFYPTSLPNLTLIPAGEMPVVERSRNARSAALVNTINEFSQNFDMLLLDIPPILVIRDSPVIAGLSDCLCLVIRQGLTPIPIVKTALDEIEHLCIRGVVMNGLKLNIPKAFQGNK